MKDEITIDKKYHLSIGSKEDFVVFTGELGQIVIEKGNAKIRIYQSKIDDFINGLRAMQEFIKEDNEDEDS